MSSSSTIIVLRSSDGKTFEVDEVVALESQTIRNMVEDGSADINNVLLPGITSNILSKVIEYCKKHTDDNVSQEQLRAFDAEFVNVDRDTLFDIIKGAYYLNIVNLVDRTCQAVADMIKGKNVDEMREIFNMENDYTPEEEEEVRRENAWAF